MKIKVFIFTICLILILSLTVVACAQQTPQTGVSGPTVTVTKTSTTTVTAPPATKPVTIHRWAPGSWIGVGIAYDQMVEMGKYLEKITNGIIEVEPSQPGAICPVEEQIEAVSSGQTSCMAPTPAYYAEKVPTAFLIYSPVFPKDVLEIMDFCETFQGGRAIQLFTQEIEQQYNVVVPNNFYHSWQCPFLSNEVINGIADLKGLKFRCGDDCVSSPLNKFGASTVWFPGTELYTAMGNKTVDACAYGSVKDFLDMGFTDVAKYWVRSPCVVADGSMETFVVNRDEWNGLSEDLKQAVITSIDAATIRNSINAASQFDAAWQEVEAKGATVIDWSTEDQNTWKAAQFAWAEDFVTKHSDPANGEIMQILKEWAQGKGYL